MNANCNRTQVPAVYLGPDLLNHGHYQLLEEPEVVLVDGLQVHMDSAPVDLHDLLDFLTEFQEVHVFLIYIVKVALRFGFCKEYYIKLKCITILKSEITSSRHHKF